MIVFVVCFMALLWVTASALLLSLGIGLKLRPGLGKSGILFPVVSLAHVSVAAQMTRL